MLNMVLWIFQVLAAGFFGMHGFALLNPPDPLPEPMLWMQDVGTPVRLFIGLAEVAAALGFILPGLTRRKTWLTPTALAGAAFVMASALVFHLFRGETANLPGNLVMGVLLSATAWAR